jgi:hypothetical protein
MGTGSLTASRRTRLRTLCAVCACALALGQAAAASAASNHAAQPPAATATLEQCVTSVVQVERSATFAGEMTAVPGTVRMAMRIEVQESLPGEADFHTLLAPGLGVWRDSDTKVRIYKYLKQVTNLSSPATYRALVRFRWLGAKGHVLKRAEHFTARCMQPAVPPASVAQASP